MLSTDTYGSFYFDWTIQDQHSRTMTHAHVEKNACDVHTVVNLSLNTCVTDQTYIYTYIQKALYIYICVYIYTYAYVYMHTYICVQKK